MSEKKQTNVRRSTKSSTKKSTNTKAINKTKPQSRGEQTKLKILAAAETAFAKEGFDAARLEDVAIEVGVRRASLFYYYKDKPALYQAVLENVMERLFETIQHEVNPQLPLNEQIENCAIAWVDYVWHHPNFTKILLREGAKPSEWLQQEISKLSLPLLNLLQELLEQAQQHREIKGSKIDPLHIASSIAGTTVFSLSIFPSSITGLSQSSDDETQLESHKENIRKLTRFLLSDI